jgi:Flp pilus assembly protein TadD/DNA repair exonuclease SbcCD ATPase subunit
MIRRFLPLVVFAGGIFSLVAADSSEQFLTAYQSYQQAEKSERDGNASDALKKYRYAESLLQEIVAKDPSWQKAVVEYRLKKTRDGVMRLQSAPDAGGSQIFQTESPPSALSQEEVPKPTPRGPSITIVAPGASSSPQSRTSQDSSSEVRRLKKQIEGLQSDLLMAREALGTDKGRSKDLDKAKWVEERSNLEKELLSAKDQIASLGDKLRARASWEKDLKELQKKLDDTVADKLAAEEIYQQRTKSSEETVARFVGELGDARRKIAEGNDVQQKYEGLSKEVEKDREVLKQLQVKLDQSQQAAKESSDKNSELQKQITQIASKLAASEKQSAELEPLRAKVKGLQAELGASREASAKAVAESEESRKASKKASEKLIAQLNGADADRSVLDEERRRLEAKLDEASKSIISLNKMVESNSTLPKQIEDLKNQLTENAKALDQSNTKVAEVVGIAEKEKTESKRREVAALSVRAQLEQQNASLQEQLKGAMSRMAALAAGNPETAPLQEKISNLERQAELNAKNFEEARRKIEEISAAKPEQEKDLKEKEKALAEAKGEAEKLRAELAASNQKISSLSQQSSQQEDRLKQLQDQLAELSKNRVAKETAAASKLDGSGQSIEQLRLSLADKDAELDRLRKLKGKTSAGEKTLEENSVLRGIIMRQVREEAKKAQARRLMEEEMKKLNIQSQSFSENIALLSVPSLSLTPEERALFKDAQLVVTEEPGKLQASVSAPIPQKEGVAEGGSTAVTPPVIKVEGTSKTPDSPVAKTGNDSVQSFTEKASVSTNAASQEIAWQGKFKDCLARAKDAFDKQDYPQAENCFKEALKLSPDDYFALSNLGVVEFQLGKMKEAEEVLLKASLKPSDSSFALTTLGIVHYRQGRLPDAEKILRKAVAINDQDFTAHNYLGIVMAASGNGKAGESEIMKAIEINKDYADAHFNLAVIYATGKPPSKMMARKHYARAVELGAPPDPSLEQLVQ